MIRWAIRQARRASSWLAARATTPWQPPWADQRIKVAFTDQEPAKLKSGRLYVASASKRPTFGYLVCPCGCGETLHLRFLPDRHPRWEVDIDADGVVSLTPSVWRQVGCRSHFFLKRGRVYWC